MIGQRLPAADESVRFIRATLTPPGFRCKGLEGGAFQSAAQRGLDGNTPSEPQREASADDLLRDH